jgi:hypothetical protein
MSLPLTPEAQQETIRLIPRDAETVGLFNLLNGNKPLPVAVIRLSVRLEIFSVVNRCRHVSRKAFRSISGNPLER